MQIEEIPHVKEPPAVGQGAAAMPQQQGGVYAATADEAVQDTAVITGTLFIHSTPAVVLFDSGSTHTFLARSFVDRIGVELDLGFDLRVSTLAGVVLTTGVGVQGVAVAFP